MKYALALIGGLIAGAVVAVMFLIANPFVRAPVVSAVEVGDNDLVVLNYSAVAEDAVVYTNDGDSRVSPNPQAVLQLWEPTIRNTEVQVAVLNDVRNVPAGIGIKFASRSEDTRLLSGQAFVDSAWHIYLPGRGSLMIGQRENYFDYLRSVVVPAQWSSSKNWKGQWRGNTTSGPGALGTAEVAGASGEFAGLETEATETLTARAYSARSGPVAVDGRLLIELPAAPDAELAADGL